MKPGIAYLLGLYTFIAIILTIDIQLFSDYIDPDFMDLYKSIEPQITPLRWINLVIMVITLCILCYIGGKKTKKD